MVYLSTTKHVYTRNKTQKAEERNTWPMFFLEHGWKEGKYQKKETLGQCFSSNTDGKKGNIRSTCTFSRLLWQLISYENDQSFNGSRKGARKEKNAYLC